MQCTCLPRCIKRIYITPHLAQYDGGMEWRNGVSANGFAAYSPATCRFRFNKADVLHSSVDHVVL